MVRFFNLYAPMPIVQQVAEQSRTTFDSDSAIVRQNAEQLALQ